MCNPLLMAVGSFALGAAQTVSGYLGQVAAADAQNEFYRQNAENARRAAIDEYAATQRRMLQEQEAAAAEKQEVAREARAASARAAVAAGEAGVSGLSVDALLRDFAGREAAFNDRVDQQTEWTLSQLQDSMKGTHARATDRIDSVQRAARPSFFDAGLRIAGIGLNSYTDYQKYRRT